VNLDINETEDGWQEPSLDAAKEEFSPCKETKSGSASIVAKQRRAWQKEVMNLREDKR
jgi:hypothetical protein